MSAVEQELGHREEGGQGEREQDDDLAAGTGAPAAAGVDERNHQWLITIVELAETV